MENPPELLVVMVITAWISGVFFGAGLVVFLDWVQRRKEGPGVAAATLPLDSSAPGNAGEADDVDRELVRLDRAIKMLGGRLNRVDPPRKGTGAENDAQDAPGSTIEKGDGSSVDPLLLRPALTRSSILRTWRERRGR